VQILFVMESVINDMTNSKNQNNIYIYIYIYIITAIINTHMQLIINKLKLRISIVNGFM